MSLADSVPGVSGGTVAFLLGFYDQFIDSIDDLLVGDLEKKKKALVFLIKLGIGWVTGFISAVLVLTQVFESHIYAISSLFIGFIIFAIPIVVKEEKEALSSEKKYVFFVLIGIVIVSLITYMNTVVSEGSGISLNHLTLGTGIYVFWQESCSFRNGASRLSGSTLLVELWGCICRSSQQLRIYFI